MVQVRAGACGGVGPLREIEGMAREVGQLAARDGGVFVHDGAAGGEEFYLGDRKSLMRNSKTGPDAMLGSM